MKTSYKIFFSVLLPGLLFAGPAGSTSISSSPLAQFQHELVSNAALHHQPLQLAAAAILARSVSGMPSLLRYSTLLHRAQERAFAGPAVTWAALGDCGDRQNLSDCINIAALHRLERQAPNNAAIWLLAFDQASQADDLAGQEHFLRRAADATVFRTYYASLLQALVRTVAAQLMPPDVVHTISGRRGNAPAAIYLLAAGNLMYLPTPALAPLFAFCTEHSRLRSVCLHLARNLIRGDTVAARTAGLALTQRLTDNPAQRQWAARQQRALAWRTQQFSGLVLRSRHNVRLAQMLLGLAQQGGTENNIQQALLHKMNRTLNPPDNWNPDGLSKH